MIKKLIRWLKKKLRVCVICGGREDVVYKDDAGNDVCYECYMKLMSE